MVSIVTPSFNQGNYIEETIRSVLLQGYPDLDYIIIDGGSKDDSIVIIRKYERWLGFWVSEPDEGCTNALNKGFDKARGELLGIMCADDYFMPGGMLKLAQLRSAKPDSVAWVGGCPEIDLAGKVINSGLPFIRGLKEIGDWGVGGWFVSVACLFRADFFRRVGRFNESFKSGTDVDMWVKLAKIGSFSLTDEIVATARFNPQSISHRDRLDELSAWITANYINGYREVAKRIMVRYAEEQAFLARRNVSPNVIADHLFRSIKQPLPLAKAFVRRLGEALGRRLNRN
jgi:glycosyltransferase involved in cell wall biosynthesis